MGYQKVKGTMDFFGDSAQKLRFVEQEAKFVAERFGFEEISTPIFENTEVFTRSSGEESDIVAKEMYTFLDKGKRSVTLRPEGTAGVARSYLENKMYSDNRLKKVFYFGPMFRYERPQAGRYRQFTQFGVEAFGEGGYLLDADIILSAWAIFERLNISNIGLKINTIGDFVSRQLYAKVLGDYFSESIDLMCPDCNRRLQKNPMRILDCKVDKDTDIMKNAPKIADYLTIESKEYFQEVLNVLDQFSIPYDVDSNLVRGLDYYTDTVFEFIIQSDDELNGLAICAGGKYSGLVQSLGGPNIPGVGYAFGVERIIAIKEIQETFPIMDNSLDVVVMALDSASKIESMQLIYKLRQSGFLTDLDYRNTTLKQQFKFVEKTQAKFIVIIGEEERLNKVVTVKNTSTGEQVSIIEEDLIPFLQSKGANQ